MLRPSSTPPSVTAEGKPLIPFIWSPSPAPAAAAAGGKGGVNDSKGANAGRLRRGPPPPGIRDPDEVLFHQAFATRELTVVALPPVCPWMRLVLLLIFSHGSIGILLSKLADMDAGEEVRKYSTTQLRVVFLTVS